ncbi:sensor histidine kinase [Spirosoma endbachense]|nr:histidine kinase [Spirosoma endbachense]
MEKSWPRLATGQPATGEPFGLLDMFADPARGMLFSLVFLLLTVYGMTAVLFMTQTLVTTPLVYADGDQIRILSSLLSVALAYGILTQFVRFEKRLATPWLKYTVLFGLTGLLTLALQRLVWIYVLDQFLQHPGPANFQRNVIYLFAPAIAVCLYFFLWQRAHSFSRTIRHQSYELARLNQLKTQAELTALQARINPHFLYNTLNSISSLVYTQPAKADEMVVELARLFQATTNASAQILAPVADEMNFVRGYLRIEQVRFGSRLRYHLEVDPAVNKVKIPRFLLQPLVENAVKHGLNDRLADGFIRVGLHQVDHWLHITVGDNGEPFPQQAIIGYGLTSIKETLQLLYEGQASLSLQNAPTKQVLIRIPL